MVCIFPATYYINNNFMKKEEKNFIHIIFIVQMARANENKRTLKQMPNSNLLLFAMASHLNGEKKILLLNK